MYIIYIVYNMIMSDNEYQVVLLTVNTDYFEK